MEEDTEHQPLIFAHSCVHLCTNSQSHTQHEEGRGVETLTLKVWLS